MKKTTRFAGGFLHITNSCNLGSGVVAVRGDLYKGKETFPHCQSLALRERWHFACEMTERVRHGRCRGFLVGAGVSASRAAKKAPVGLFCPAGRKRRAAAVRIHPRGCDFGFLQKKKDQRIFYAGLFGGRGWIRTSRTLSCGFLPALNPMVSCRFSDSHQNGRCIHTHSGAHKSGLQSGLHCERLQRVRHCQRSGCVLPLHGVTVPPKRVHALAVAHHAAQLCWR